MFPFQRRVSPGDREVFRGWVIGVALFYGAVLLIGATSLVAVQSFAELIKTDVIAAKSCSATEPGRDGAACP